MSEYEIKNAVIEKAEIIITDNGVLDAWLSLGFGGSGQGFGGFALYLPKSFTHHSLLSVAGHHIFRILQIAEVEKWSQLPGKTIRVEGSWTDIIRIGHIVKDDWYSPKSDFAAAHPLKKEDKISSAPPAPPDAAELRMSGENARRIILNCHAILRHKFRKVPLWSMVGKITGHGSGNSAAICESANLDPHQNAASKVLLPCQNPVK